MKDIPRFLVVSLLASGVLGCGNGVIPRTEVRSDTPPGPLLPDAYLTSAVRSFCVDALNIVPLEITPLTFELKAVTTRTFRVIHHDGLNTSLTSVNPVTGVVMGYSAQSVGEQEAESIVREYYPEKYAEYVEFKKNCQKEQEAERAWEAALHRDEGSSVSTPSQSQEQKPDSHSQEMSREQAEQLAPAIKSRREERDRVAKEWNKLLEWKPEYERVSREAASEKVKPILQHFGLPLDMRRFFWGQSMTDEKDRWIIVFYLDYAGIPCLGKSLRINISRFSGTVISVDYDPITEVPKQVASPISKADALKIASKSVGKNDAFKWTFFRRAQEYDVNYDVDMEDIVEYIALPEAYLGMSRKERAIIKKMSPTEPRYCWEVPFTYTMTRSYDQYIPEEKRGASLFVVYVDMETGNVLHAGSRMPVKVRPI